MISICVASYSVIVRCRHKSDRLQLGLKPGPSVYDVVLKTLRGLKSHQRHPKSPHVIKAARIEFDGSNVWGVIERGEYGHTATGVNSKTFDLSYAVNACSCLTLILSCIVYGQAREIPPIAAAPDFPFDPAKLKLRVP